MKKGIIAIMLGLGCFTFASAQDNNNTYCSNNDQSQINSEYFQDESNSGTEEGEMYEMNDFSSNQDFNNENKEDYSYETESNVTVQPANDLTSSNVVIKEEKDQSTLRNVVEAPFKYAGHVITESAEGVGYIVGGTAKGVAYIVASPVRALFGKMHKDRDKNKDMTQEMYMPDSTTSALLNGNEGKIKKDVKVKTDDYEYQKEVEVNNDGSKIKSNTNIKLEKR